MMLRTLDDLDFGAIVSDLTRRKMYVESNLAACKLEDSKRMTTLMGSLEK